MNRFNRNERAGADGELPTHRLAGIPIHVASCHSVIHQGYRGGNDCFAYITDTPVLLTGVLLAGALMVGVATPQVQTKEVNYEPTY